MHFTSILKTEESSQEQNFLPARLQLLRKINKSVRFASKVAADKK